MRKNRKAMTAMALAVGMAAAASVASYAAPSAEETSVKAEGTAVTEILGTIQATTLKVSVPLKAAFDIDPGAYEEATKMSQVTVAQSDNYAIKNDSTVPVWVYISSIDAGGLAGTSPTKTASLTTDPADLDTGLKVMLAIKSGLTDPAITVKDTAAFWIPPTLSGGKYYMDTAVDGTTSTNHGKIEAGTTMNLNVYALTKTGWSNADTFAFKPTFTVAVKDPTAP